MKTKSSLYKSVLIALCLSLLVFSVALAAAGDLDTTFSGDGKIVQGFGGTSDYGSSIAVQADGKVVVGGEKGTSTFSDFAIARYTTAGLLDTTFSGDGKQTVHFGVFDHVGSVLIQSDGKIVVVGSACKNNGSTWTEHACKVVLARLNSNGTLDTSFGVNGKVITDLAGDNEVGNGATLQGAKIVVSGYSYAGNVDYNAIILRYNPDGQLDTTFSGDGILLVNAGWWDDFFTVTFSGQKIIAAGKYSPPGGSVWSDILLARVNLDGTLDTTFGTGGIVKTDLGNNDGATGVAVIGGKIVLAGYSGGSGALVQYTSAGKLDPTFSGDGKLRTNLGFSGATFNGIANQNGKILVSGYVWNDAWTVVDAVVARFWPVGAVDASFGGDGVITTNWGGDDFYNSVIFKNSRIYTVGNTTNASDVSRFIIAKYLP